VQRSIATVYAVSEPACWSRYSNSTFAPLGANCAEAHRYRGPICDQPTSWPPKPPKTEVCSLRDTSGIHSDASPLTKAVLASSNRRRNASKLMPASPGIVGARRTTARSHDRPRGGLRAIAFARRTVYFASA
jgi:hypothetical protein